MLDNYIKEQYISTTLLKRAIKNNKVVQAYLFVGNNILYLEEYAKAFSKELIFPTNSNNYNIMNSIDLNTYPELKIISPDGNYIKKSQLIELQNSVKTKPILGKKIIYIIKECDKLNLSSANSMLKFLEDPSDDVVAILLTNNINNVLPTITSRCQILNLNNINDNKSYSNLEYLNLIVADNMEYDEFEKIVYNCIDFINELENKKINVIINIKKYVWNNFIENDNIDILLKVMSYFYMDVLYYKLENKPRYFGNAEIENISSKNENDDIINKIYILEKLKQEKKYNVNSKLIIDKLIIEMSEVNG